MQGIVVFAFSMGSLFSSCSTVFLILLLEYLKQNVWKCLLIPNVSFWV